MRFAVFAVVLFISTELPAQTAQRPAPKAAARVLAGKRVFYGAQPVRLAVALVNEGSKGFYIAKTFEEAGGGIAGFYYQVHQLTGKLPHAGCGHAGDRGMDVVERPAEQVLKEDYIYLPAGAFVGYELSPLPCELRNPGKYRIEVFYSAQDLNVSRVAKLQGLDSPVLTGYTNKVSAIIEIRAASSQGKHPGS